MSDSDFLDSRKMDQVRKRVEVPALMLIIGGCLNLAVAIYFVLGIVFMSEEDRKIAAKSSWDANKEQFVQQGMTQEEFENLFRVTADVILGTMATATVIAIIAIIGGLRMRQLRSRGLAITGASLMAIPCLSPLGCLLIGEAIGIWCLVVLLTEDVGRAFAEAQRDTYRSEGEGEREEW